MGVTIYYHGRLHTTNSLPQLTQELIFAAEELGWKYNLVDERILGTLEVGVCIPDPDDEDLSYVHSEYRPIDERLQGIVIWPPGAESLHITFNRAGDLVFYMPTPEEGVYWLMEYQHCKTQFSDIETHIAVCNLLRLVEPHMAEWEVEDEGDYWQSGNRAQLEEKLAQLNAIMQQFKSKEGAEFLSQLTGEEIQSEDIEIGKEIEMPKADWQNDRGLSAHEN